MFDSVVKSGPLESVPWSRRRDDRSHDVRPTVKSSSDAQRATLDRRTDVVDDGSRDQARGADDTCPLVG